MNLHSIAVDEGCTITVGEMVKVDNEYIRGEYKVTALWVHNTIHLEIEVERTDDYSRWPVIGIEDIEW